MDRDLVTWAREYLAMNAAESGADILIEKLSDEVERLRGIIVERERNLVITTELLKRARERIPDRESKSAIAGRD